MAAHLKRILVTAGPTREYLDPVRFITNLSSGEMGYAIAREAVRQKYQVSLVSGPVNLTSPKGVRFFPVVTASQMKKVCMELFSQHDGLIMTAAVCDFTPEKTERHKVPSGSGLMLRLKRTPDILAALAKKKGKKVVIGFCLETQELMDRARQKLIQKRLDGIVANFYCPGRDIPFGKRRIDVAFIGRDLKIQRYFKKTKPELAKKILAWMQQLG